MRVIAGTAKGRSLTAPPGRTIRPTADRVKEAMFSILMPRLPDAVVADLFAGSGALGIEALSRGAARAVFVERSDRALDALRDNLAVCGFADRATVLAEDVDAALARGLDGTAPSVVVADPPYTVDDAALAALVVAVGRIAAPGGWVVLETRSDRPPPPWPGQLRPAEPRRYGDTALHVATVDREP